jgi:hypothetical protein
MEFEMNPYIVYIKSNEFDFITAINSSAFLTDLTNWIEIDRGYGDKYHHAQGNYFPKSIMTDNGAYRYKLVDGKSVECSAKEIAELLAQRGLTVDKKKISADGIKTMGTHTIVVKLHPTVTVKFNLEVIKA